MIRKKDLLGEFNETPPCHLHTEYNTTLPVIGEVKSIKGEQVFCLNVYREETIYAKVFLYGEDDHCTYRYDKDKWSGAKLENILLDMHGWITGCRFVCDDATLNLAREFFHETNNDYSISKIICDFQQQRLDEKSSRRREKKEKTIKSDMALFSPTLPDDWEEFHRNTMLKDGYPMLFDPKQKTCHCTRCNTDMTYTEIAKRPMQGKPIKCPKCGGLDVGKSVNRNTEVTLIKWSVLAENNNGTLLFRYFRHWCFITPNEYLSPNKREGYSEVYRSVFGGESYMNYTGSWEKYREPRGFNYFCDPSVWKAPVHGTIPYPTCGEVMESVDRFKYSGARSYCDGHLMLELGWYSPEVYLHKYESKPYLEMLSKCKLFGLFRDINYWHSGIIRNPLATNIRGLLGLSKRELKILRKDASYGVAELNVIRRLSALLTDDDISYVISDKVLTKKHVQISTLLRETSFKKFKGYIEKTGCNLTYFFDTQDMRRQLGYPKDYIFPKDLKATHDMFVEESNRRKDELEKKRHEEKAQKLKQTVEEMLKIPAYTFSNDSMCVVIPSEYEQFANESKVLNHCVRTYFDRVADKQTHIFFIRQSDKIDEPYFTLELDNKFDVVQCHTKNNRRSDAYDKDNGTHVTEFANQYSQRLKRMVLNAA